VCIVIIKGYYSKKVINNALKIKSDIHFEANFFTKTTIKFCLFDHVISNMVSQARGIRASNLSHAFLKKHQ